MQRFTAVAVATPPLACLPACQPYFFAALPFLILVWHTILCLICRQSHVERHCDSPVLLPPSPPLPLQLLLHLMPRVQLTVTRRILSVCISASTAHAIFKLRPYRPLTWPAAMVMIGAKLHKFCNNSSTQKKNCPKTMSSKVKQCT